MYCRNCGKELSFQPVVCLACGAPPPRGDRFCQRCGVEVAAAAQARGPAPTSCPKCSAHLARLVAERKGKRRAVAVLLAIFLGYWTWLYTYRRDGWKFWLCLAASLANVLFAFVIRDTPRGLWSDIAVLVALALWAWTITDAVTKNREWYRSY